MARTAARQVSTPHRDLQKDMGAAAVLIEQIKALLGEENADAITLHDMVEGETGLFEAVDGVLQQIGEDAARIDGIKKFKQTLDARMQRLDNRVESMRTMLTNCLEMLGERKWERPIATISLRDVTPKLAVVDESMIPTQYFVQPEPTLSRKLLGDALKARNDALEAYEAEAQAAGVEEGSPAYSEGLQKIIAAHPPIPGAELDNGGITVAIRFG